MSTSSITVAPRGRFDDQGRLVPLNEAERAQHAAAILSALALLDEISDDPNEDSAEFFRAVDSHRPERPLFDGLY